MGRFINADGYASTGQGLLGNNMFAYCNNCPIIYTDDSGTRPVAYGENGEESDRSRERPYTKRTSPADLSGGLWENAKNNVTTIIDEFKNAGSIQDHLDIAKKIIAYEDVETVFGAYKVISGVKKVGKGIAELGLPLPTHIDELMGAAHVVLGFKSIVQGVCEIFNWTEATE